jgi:ABC-type uncharacterized transport system auxiliary subunit
LRLAAALSLLLFAAGCGFNNPPAEPRYFSPGLQQVSEPDPARGAELTPLRLRRVRAAAYLRDRMVWRRGVEIGFYELWRWTESPARFAQARLEEELFSRLGFQRSRAASAPALAVSLDAFDEVLGPAHEAWVALSVELDDAKNERLLDHTYEVRKPISGNDPGQVADALGQALDEAVRQLGAGVDQALRARPL